MSRLFHLGDILSIVTGKLVSPRHVKGVYDILDYMTGDNLFAHQLPRACNECRSYLLVEMPWLAEVDASTVSSENWEQWIDDLVEKYGEYHSVLPIHPEDHENIDPVDELNRMGVDESRIISIINFDLNDEKPTSPYRDINWKTNEDDEDEE